ncbi:MAG: hypothetical protein ABR616_10295, partial [Dermatophilaceae bacterium]
WRAVSLGAAVTGTAIASVLILAGDEPMSGSDAALRVGVLAATTLSLTIVAGTDVYERFALGRTDHPKGKQ